MEKLYFVVNIAKICLMSPMFKKPLLMSCPKAIAWNSDVLLSIGPVKTNFGQV